MQHQLIGRSLSRGVIGVASAIIANASAADITIDISDFSVTGGEFQELFASGDLAGTLTGVGVDVVLTGSQNFTWADDFTISIGSDGSTGPLVQAGGFSDFGALERINWINGASGDDGTTCVDAQDLTTPVVPFSVSIGNGYASGGNGTWNGTLTLFGVNASDSQDPVQWRVEDGGNGHW